MVKAKKKPVKAKGIEPMTKEMKEIIIEGKKYKPRRLRVRDTFKLGRIIASAASGLGSDLKSIDSDVAVKLLIAGMPFCENLIIDFMSDIMGVSSDDFDNPDIFPVGSEIVILSEILQSYDAKHFFSQCKTIIEPMMTKN